MNIVINKGTSCSIRFAKELSSKLAIHILKPCNFDEYKNYHMIVQYDTEGLIPSKFSGTVTTFIIDSVDSMERFREVKNDIRCVYCLDTPETLENYIRLEYGIKVVNPQRPLLDHGMYFIIGGENKGKTAYAKSFQGKKGLIHITENKVIEGTHHIGEYKYGTNTLYIFDELERLFRDNCESVYSKSTIAKIEYLVEESTQKNNLIFIILRDNSGVAEFIPSSLKRMCKGCIISIGSTYIPELFSGTTIPVSRFDH